jgi:uncharacterized protein
VREQAKTFCEALAPIWDVSGAGQARILEQVEAETPNMRRAVGTSPTNYFVYKLIPPRPTFPVAMTDAEAAIMDQHFAYWWRFDVVLGPVLDASGTCGLGVIAGDDPNDITALGRGPDSQVGNVNVRGVPHGRPIHPLLAHARAARARSTDTVLRGEALPQRMWSSPVLARGSLDAPLDDSQMESSKHPIPAWANESHSKSEGRSAPERERLAEPLCGARAVGAAVSNQILEA